MTAVKGRQVTLTVPDGAPPGTLLAVPVSGGDEKVKVRVPPGMGAGSQLVLTQAEGSEEWIPKVSKLVPVDGASSQPNGIGTSQKEEEDEALRAQATHAELDQQELEKLWFQQQLESQAPEAQQQMPETMQPNEVAQVHSGAPVEEIVPIPPALEVAVAYTVRLETTVGTIDIIVRPDWAPHGTRRFLELAAAGDLNELAFYRAIKGCIVQFGLPARRPWPPIPDDPPTGVPFLLGAVSFAAVGENSRKSTLFICIGDMSHCLGQNPWETPIGAVAESSLDVLDRVETIYGDIAEFNGAGPDTNRINVEGNGYLGTSFPLLTWIHSVQPLDWQASEDLQTRPAQQRTPTQTLPATVPMAQCDGMQPGDHAARAANFAMEAQAQATQAAQLAQQAARAEHVSAAAQAAQAAQAAAEAAKMSAQQAASAAAMVASFMHPQGAALDVPVEIMMNRNRASLMPSPIPHQPPMLHTPYAVSGPQAGHAPPVPGMAPAVAPYGASSVMFKPGRAGALPQAAAPGPRLMPAPAFGRR